QLRFLSVPNRNEYRVLILCMVLLYCTSLVSAVSFVTMTANAPEALRSVLHFAKPSDVRSPWKGLGRQSLRGDVTEARRDFVTSFRGYASGRGFYPELFFWKRSFLVSIIYQPKTKIPPGA